MKSVKSSQEKTHSCTRQHAKFAMAPAKKYEIGLRAVRESEHPTCHQRGAVSEKKGNVTGKLIARHLAKKVARPQVVAAVLMGVESSATRNLQGKGIQTLSQPTSPYSYHHNHHPHYHHRHHRCRRHHHYHHHQTHHHHHHHLLPVDTMFAIVMRIPHPQRQRRPWRQPAARLSVRLLRNAAP